jgi:membrane protease YdiL (CAAX protease family)
MPSGVEMADLAPGDRKTMLWGNIAVSLAIVGLGFPLIALRTGATMRDLGLSFKNVLSDLRLGLVGFVLLAPPVYALQGLLIRFWQPSHHPLVELFKGAPDPLFFGLLFLSAAIVAPLLEELLFRVLWQGFLEKCFTFDANAEQLLLGGNWRSDSALPGDVPLSDETSSMSDSGLLTEQEQPEPQGPQAWLPIFLSASIFALLHLSHGPDWVPLLLLAAGMGYLYQRTHRLLPSLVVHCLLNSYSLWGLWIQVHTNAS